MFWRRWHPSLSGENTRDCLPHKSKGSTLWEEWRTPPQMTSVHGKIHVISVWCCTKMEFPASEDFLTIYICGIYPTSWKQLFYHPLYCCIPWCRAQAPAHSAFLTRLHLPALWSSSRHRAELTQAHQHLSCRGPPEPEEILRTWWVVSAELVGNKHFPWPTNFTWPVCVKFYHNLCLPKIAWIAVHCRFFFAKPGEEYMLKQKYVHFRVKCPPPVSKTQKLFNFWQTLLIKYNLWMNRFALFYFGNASSKKFLFKKR